MHATIMSLVATCARVRELISILERTVTVCASCTADMGGYVPPAGLLVVASPVVGLPVAVFEVAGVTPVALSIYEINCAM